MMTIHFTCKECGSAINVYPDKNASRIKCDICAHEQTVHFTEEHEHSFVHQCPECERKDFYTQKDFNRKIGVTLFVIAAILSLWTYGISLILLYILDLFLFRKLRYVIICYKCNAVFRGASNWKEIPGFNHEMNDRIIYSDHNFEGEKLKH